MRDRIIGLHGCQLAHRHSHGTAHFDRPTKRVAVPEGNPARLARRGCDHHLRGCDVGHPPAGGSEHEHLAGAHLVHHLLVELADFLPVIEQIHRKKPAVRDRATADDRQALCAGPATDRSLEPVPDDARPELGELVRGIAPAEHVER